MRVKTFTAGSAPDAVAQIRAELGPDAVVLDVRQSKPEGLGRWWQKSRIEVLACVPEAGAPAQDTYAELREQIAELRKVVELRAQAPAPAMMLPDAPIDLPTADSAEELLDARTPASRYATDWRIRTVLERGGMLPLHAQQTVEKLQAFHGETPPGSLAQEIKFARSVLTGEWKLPESIDFRRPQVLIGPAGTGKTTCLCKWLTQLVLLAGKKVSVWRLDGETANTAGALSVYCDVLGVPIERASVEVPIETEETAVFIDLPGVNWRDPAAVQQLASRLEKLNAQAHLVLNGAYETALLLAQARTFAALPLGGLIVTHLDEEARWGKLWNLVLGTNCSLRFLSAGQNVPGYFQEACPESVLSAHLPVK